MRIAITVVGIATVKDTSEKVVRSIHVMYVKGYSRHRSYSRRNSFM